MRIVSNKHICRKCSRYLRLIVHTRYTMCKDYEQQYVTNDLAHLELSIHKSYVCSKFNKNILKANIQYKNNMFYSCVNSPYEMTCTVCSVISFCCKYIKRYFKT